MGKARLAGTALKNARQASAGRCTVCGHRTVFLLTDEENTREGFRCVRCGSIARNRLVALALSSAFGGKTLSEVGREGLPCDVYISAASGRLLRALPVGMPRLQTSEYLPDLAPGALLPDGHSTCQDLQQLTYDDESFDIVVTEDVLEHVRAPDACFSEIHRVLRPGGQHIFTVPFRPDRPTLVRVDTSGAEDVLLMEAEWHGDPLRGRILAYRTFGYDIFKQMRAHGFETELLRPTLRNRWAGIHDADVFVATKV